MFNNHQYNQVQYNGELTVTVNEESSSDSVSFNGYGLNNDTIFLSNVRITGPSRQFESFNNLDTHGKTNTVDYFRTGSIVLNGYIIRDSVSDLETYIDSLYIGLSVKEQYISIDKGNSTRRYKATWINTDSSISRENYHKEYVPFEFKFLIEDPPFGEDEVLSTNTEEAVTSYETSFVIENTGNVETFLNILLLINSATSISLVQVENTTTGEYVTVNRALIAGDVLQINGEITGSGNDRMGKDVLLNGSNIGYSGIIPNLQVGNNTVIVRVASSAHDADIILFTRNRYLI